MRTENGIREIGWTHASRHAQTITNQKQCGQRWMLQMHPTSTYTVNVINAIGTCSMNFMPRELSLIPNECPKQLNNNNNNNTNDNNDNNNDDDNNVVGRSSGECTHLHASRSFHRPASEHMSTPSTLRHTQRRALFASTTVACRWDGAPLVLCSCGCGCGCA